MKSSGIYLQRTTLLMFFALFLSGCGGANDKLEPERPLIVPIAEAVGPADISKHLEHYQAFSELLNYVRFFYPGDEALETDWESFALVGMRRIHQAQDGELLVDILTELFADVAPLLELDGSPLHEFKTAEGEQPVAYWRHFGFGFGFAYGNNAPFYTNERRVDQAGHRSEFRPRATFYDATLTSDIHMRLPLELSMAGGRTQPEVAGFAPDESEFRLNSSFQDLYVRLATVALAWGVFQHFNPYMDDFDIDWSTQLSTTLKKAAQAKSLVETGHLLREMLYPLQDGHGWVYFQGGMAPYSLPLTFHWIEEQIVVTQVWGSAVGTVKPGFVVTEINGQPVMEALATLLSRSTIGDEKRHQHSVPKLAFGEPGKRLDVVFLTNDGTRLSTTLEYQVARNEAPNTYHLVPMQDGVSRVADGIKYFNWINYEQDPKSVLSELEGANAVILDWRGYPNSYTEDLYAHVCSEELVYPPMITYQWQAPDRFMPFVARETNRLESTASPLISSKIVLITGRNTQSAADTGASVLKECDNVTLLGEATNGANGNVTNFSLFGGLENGGVTIWFSGMRVLQTDRSQMQGIGVAPNVPVSVTRQGIMEQRDELLDAAIEWVKMR